MADFDAGIQTPSRYRATVKWQDGRTEVLEGQDEAELSRRLRDFRTRNTDPRGTPSGGFTVVSDESNANAVREGLRRQPPSRDASTPDASIRDASTPARARARDASTATVEAARRYQATRDAGAVPSASPTRDAVRVPESLAMPLSYLSSASDAGARDGGARDAGYDASVRDAGARDGGYAVRVPERLATPLSYLPNSLDAGARDGGYDAGRQPVARLTRDNGWGALERGNIDLDRRPHVRNADGSMSTVRSMGVGIDGKQYLIPTVSDDGRIMSDDEAVREFKRTGRHLGVYASPAESDRAGQAIHEDQERNPPIDTLSTRVSAAKAVVNGEAPARHFVVGRDVETGAETRFEGATPDEAAKRFEETSRTLRKGLMPINGDGDSMRLVDRPDSYARRQFDELTPPDVVSDRGWTIRGADPVPMQIPTQDEPEPAARSSRTPATRTPAPRTSAAREPAQPDPGALGKHWVTVANKDGTRTRLSADTPEGVSQLYRQALEREKQISLVDGEPESVRAISPELADLREKLGLAKKVVAGAKKEAPPKQGSGLSTVLSDVSSTGAQEPAPTTEQATAKAREIVDQDEARDRETGTPGSRVEPAAPQEQGDVSDVLEMSPAELQRKILEEEIEANRARTARAEATATAKGELADKATENVQSANAREQDTRNLVTDLRSKENEIYQRMMHLTNTIADEEAERPTHDGGHIILSLIAALIAAKSPGGAAIGKMLQSAIPTNTNRWAARLEANKDEYDRMAKLYGIRTRGMSEQLEQEAMLHAAAIGSIKAKTDQILASGASEETKAYARELGAVANQSLYNHAADLARREAQRGYEMMSIDQLSRLMGEGQLPEMGQAILSEKIKREQEPRQRGANIDKTEADLANALLERERMQAETRLKRAQAHQAEMQARYGEKPTETEARYDILVRNGQQAFERLAKMARAGRALPQTAMTWSTPVSRLSAEDEQMRRDVELLLALNVRAETGAAMPPAEIEQRASHYGVNSLRESQRRDGLQGLLLAFEGMDRLGHLRRIDWEKAPPSALEAEIFAREKAESEAEATERSLRDSEGQRGRGAGKAPKADPLVEAQRAFERQELQAQQQFGETLKGGEVPRVTLYDSQNAPRETGAETAREAFNRGYTLTKKPPEIIEYYKRLEQAQQRRRELEQRKQQER